MEDSTNPWTILNDDGIEKSILSITEDDNQETEEQKKPKKKEEPEPDDSSDESDDSDDAASEESSSTKVDNNGEESSDDEPEETDVIEYLAKTFSEKGLLTIPEGLEVKSEEDLDKVIEHTINEGIEAYKEQFDPETRSLINYLELGGTVEEYLNGAATPSVEDYDLSDEDNQKTIYRAYLEATINIADPEKKSKKIEKLLDEAELEDTLTTEAEEAKAFFIEQRKYEQEALIEEQKQRQAEEEKQRKHIESTVVNIIHSAEDINELPLGTKKDRKELEDYIFSPTVPHVIEDSNGKKKTIKITQYQADKIKMAESEEVRLKMFLFDAMALKRGYKFDPIKKKGVTEHNKSLQQKAEEYRKKKEAELKGHKVEPGSKAAPGYSIFE